VLATVAGWELRSSRPAPCTTTSVLGLVELVVDDVLKHDKQNADDDWEEGDANVCLPVPFLHQ
jgi:hypothetical protein